MTTQPTKPDTPSPMVSILDVLENAIGDLSPKRISELTTDDLQRLADVVNAFYDSWETPAVGGDELRVYSGGWIAGNSQAVEARQYLYTSLVYAPSVVIHDPIADWFEPSRDRLQSPPAIRGATGGVEVQGAEPQLLRSDGYFVFREEPERSREYLTWAVAGLLELAPLIRKAVVIPVPQWRLVRQRQDAILTAVRHDGRDEALAALIAGAADEPPPRSDRIRGMETTPPGGTIPADAVRAVVQNPAYFLNKTLGIAEATQSRYLPPASTDAALLDYRLRKLGDELRRKDTDLQVVAGLVAAELPFLGALDAATIVAIRRDETAFADWRAELRNTARVIESNPSDGEKFAAEAREVVSDALLPRAHEVRRAVSRSSVMKAAAKDQGVTLSVSAAAITGGAVIAGTPLAPAALAGIGISAVARWAYASVFGHSTTGTRGILATLTKKR